MMAGQFHLRVKTNRANQSVLGDCFVSQPFKFLRLPTPVSGWANAITVMQMNASPGILAGDRLDIRLQLAENTACNLTSQAFTRVHSMSDGQSAEQQLQIELAQGAKLCYLPHPLVLHKDAAFAQQCAIQLADNCQLIYGDIINIGRVLNNERFAFRRFSSYLTLHCSAELLFLDNIQWHPEQMDLTALGQMEDFSHQGTLLFVHTTPDGVAKEQVNELYDWVESLKLERCLFGLSQPFKQGLVVRILAHNAEQVYQLFQQLAEKLRYSN